MGDYNRSGRSDRNRRGDGNRRFGGRGGGFRGRDSARREMHRTVCDECGKNCEVPFRPSGDKPIFCSDCFEKKNGGDQRMSDRRDSGGPRFEKRDDTNKRLLEQMSLLNSKLDRVLALLEASKVEEKPFVKKPQTNIKLEKATQKDSSEAKKEKKKVSKKKASQSTDK